MIESLDTLAPFAARAFTSDRVSDEKRLVRGEHYLFARRLLRVRDGVHHAKWRILVLAGHEARGEVSCIRELMPKAHIVAVDRDVEAVRAAIAAGANDSYHGDLGDFMQQDSVEDFDIGCLDFCGGITDDMVRLVTDFRTRRMAPSGVCIVTFCYGRDVVEVALHRAQMARLAGTRQRRNEAAAERLQRHYKRLGASGADERMIGRILAFSGLAYLRSVMVYRGAAMPMCSLLFWQSRAASNGPISYVKVGAGDFEIAATCPDPTLMYASPQGRIEGLRRKHAAIKASYTRRASKEPEGDAA